MCFFYLLGSFMVFNSKPLHSYRKKCSHNFSKKPVLFANCLPRPQKGGAKTQRSGSHGRIAKSVQEDWAGYDIQSFAENAVHGCRSSSFPSALGCLLMTHSGKLQGPGILFSYYMNISISLYRPSLNIYCSTEHKQIYISYSIDIRIVYMMHLL